MEDLSQHISSLFSTWQSSFKFEFTAQFICFFLVDVILSPSSKNWYCNEYRGQLRYKSFNKLILEFVIGAHLALFSACTLTYFHHLVRNGLIDIHYDLPSLSTFLWELFAFFFFIDFQFYWSHRFLHWSKIYHYAHKLHHRSIYLTPFSSANFSVLEVLLQVQSIVIILVNPFYKMHLISLEIYSILGVLHNIYSHLGVELCPRWFYSIYPTKLLVTSSYHEFHHFSPKYNFSLYLTYLDRIFHTIGPNFDKSFYARWNSPMGTESKSQTKTE